ncbi:MAG: VTT domain-containing protein [Vicinamibacterales bacterium]
MTQWFNALLLQIAQMGSWGAVAFIGLYILAALIMAPAFPLTVAAGAIYGVLQGSVVVFIGAALGGFAAYGVALRLAGTRWLRRFDDRPRVVLVREAMANNGVWVQFLLRLSPIIPFTILNYALGLARVRPRDFTVALLGMVPTIVLYTYYGKVVGDVAALAAGNARPQGPAYYWLLSAGLASTLIATLLISRAAKRALAGKPGGPEGPPYVR